MPQNCCVPGCKKKLYLENGMKISYHKFSENKALSKKWIVAIRRDLGRHFKITDHTRVCSRHFKPQDYIFTFAGRKRTLKQNAVPSQFSWNQGSPIKRKSPKKRSPIKRKQTETTSKSLTGTSNSESMCDHQLQNLPSTSNDCENENAFEDAPMNDSEAIIREREKENERLSEELRRASEEQDNLRTELEELQRQNVSLQNRVFSVEKFVESDKDLSFYTGFPSLEVFQSVYDFLDPGNLGENIFYWHSADSTTSAQVYDEDTPKQGRPRQLSTKEEYFLTLCRLRQGFKEEHLGHLYGISQTTVSRIIISWINFIFLKFSTIPLWPSRNKVDEYMPADFKEKYPSTRVIIDCTEVRCQMPKSLRLNSELFSSYKNHTTLKGLIGISPGGAITFISQLYTGHISDREIVTRSGFLDLPFENGDAVMADKGFTIEDLLPVGVHLNIPPFLGSKGQMSPEEVAKTQSIASLRIHVERAINKIKNFHIWDTVVPFTLFGVVNQMWTVCSFLCNCQNSIISA